MARPASEFSCNQCGNVTTKWSGKCEACGAWNTISEAAASKAPPVGRGAKKTKGQSIELTSLAGEDKEPERSQSGLGEFDRVLGGGIVPGSATLIGGDPGIGKSTLLLQAAAAIGKKGGQVVYVSGEEALAQLRMRASRLGLADAPVQLAAETNVADICKTLENKGSWLWWLSIPSRQCGRPPLKRPPARSVRFARPDKSLFISPSKPTHRLFWSAM